MRNGFTLIELLFIIIILGILALITTPIILETITNSKKNSMRVSVENYLDAVENEIARVNVNIEYETLDGIYTISDGGKTITRDSNTIFHLDYNGKGLESGQLVVTNGLVKQIINGVIDKWYAKIESEKVILLEEISDNTLVTD